VRIIETHLLMLLNYRIKLIFISLLEVKKLLNHYEI